MELKTPKKDFEKKEVEPKNDSAKLSSMGGKEAKFP